MEPETTYLMKIVGREFVQTQKGTQKNKQYLRTGQEKEALLWMLEVVDEDFFRIKNVKTGEYLTYVKKQGQHGQGYSNQCRPLAQGEDGQYQLWQIQLAENWQYKIKNKKDDHYLELPSKNPGNQQILQIRAEYPQRIQHQEGIQKIVKTSKQEQNEPSPRTSQIAILSLSKKQPIPDFTGKIYQKNDWGYQQVIYQYASSSLPPEMTTPFLVCYPKFEQQIIYAIIYANDNKKKVVARSGGHQYTGKSSGGQDTIVISMDNFTAINKMKENPDIVQIQPCVKLHDLNKKLTQWGLSVPHGQCPKVAIGSHAQTGGYGHFLRSFGLNGDYVQGFNIVLSDGRFFKVVRPSSKWMKIQMEDQQLNKKLFRSVLSGNAGSFGIVTKYYYSAIKDSDHPKSWGYSKVRLFDPDIYADMMKECQKWTQIIQKGQDNEKIKGCDFMMSLKSSMFSNFLPLKILDTSLIIIQLMYSDQEGGKPYAGQFDEIIAKYEKKQFTLKQKFLHLFMASFHGEMSLSKMAQSWVRKPPAVTQNGREFPYPYLKRVELTNNALSDDFIKEFTALVIKTMIENQVKMIFQMGLGGGASRDKGKDNITGYPHRKAVYTFVYDLFYPSEDSMKVAIVSQNKMQNIVDKYYNNDKQEKRLFWGTFGITDITNPTIRSMYYDDEQSYKQFQEVKKLVDPTDTFHTDLTVKLPN